MPYSLEDEILKLHADGLSSEDIAEALYIPVEKVDSVIMMPAPPTLEDCAYRLNAAIKWWKETKSERNKQLAVLQYAFALKDAEPLLKHSNIAMIRWLRAHKLDRLWNGAPQSISAARRLARIPNVEKWIEGIVGVVDPQRLIQRVKARMKDAEAAEKPQAESPEMMTAVDAALNRMASTMQGIEERLQEFCERVEVLQAEKRELHERVGKLEEIVRRYEMLVGGVSVGQLTGTSPPTFQRRGRLRSVPNGGEN